jgi:superfamily I DNA and/or RNA helicase
VLFALKPCWAMSPLMVSQVLPASRLFDLVIFDEASQIVPADAIASMIRAHQVVVAGDDHQLPPTTSSARWTPVTGRRRRPGRGAGVVRRRLRVGPRRAHAAAATCPLNWHYRSRDERLVAFSNDGSTAAR